jgi:hypothetical protein
MGVRACVCIYYCCEPFELEQLEQKILLRLSQYGVRPSEGIAMINLSLRRYLPAWFRSETGDFYLTILFTAVATAELTYWGLRLPL